MIPAGLVEEITKMHSQFNSMTPAGRAVEIVGEGTAKLGEGGEGRELSH